MPGLLDLFTGGGMTSGGGGGLGDFLRSRVQSWQAHPFQNIVGTLAGGFGGMGGGMAANNFFSRYNDNKFNNAANTLYDRSRDLSQLNTNDAMNKPLGNDALSGENGFNWNGPTGPNNGTDYQGPGMSGGGGGTYAGGPLGHDTMPQQGGYTGPSMTGQQWQDRSGGYGNLVGQTMGVAPDQPSSFVNDILDSISMGPGLPGSGQLRGPQAHRDYREGLALNGPGVGNYGVSNFMVGGSPVIFGAGDPNGRYRTRGTEYGG